MNELALFAGAGGGILGSILLGHRIVCAVEIDEYCRRVLLQRQRDGILPWFPIWDDARTFAGQMWRGVVDLVSAGFPCQPFSVAGRRRGEGDERNLWPDTIRVLREVGPRWALLENVPGLVRSPYFGTILGDLADAGFDAEWDVVSAAEVGAPHIRKRLWILAHAANNRSRWREQLAECGEGERHVGNTSPAGCQNIQGCEESTECTGSRTTRRTGWWDIEPDVGRVAHGVASRVDRLRALGNGQVPRVVVETWERLRCK